MEVELDILRPGENTADIDFGEDLTDLLGSGGGDDCGGYRVDPVAIQAAFASVVGYFNLHQWAASTVKALYTLDSLLTGLQVDVEEHRVQSQSSRCSVASFSGNRRRSNSAASRYAYVPIFNIFQVCIYIYMCMSMSMCICPSIPTCACRLESTSD